MTYGGLGSNGFPLLVVDPSFITIVVAANAGPVGPLLKNVKGVAKEKLVDHFGPVGGFGSHRDCGKETACLHYI